MLNIYQRTQTTIHTFSVSFTQPATHGPHAAHRSLKCNPGNTIITYTIHINKTLKCA